MLQQNKTKHLFLLQHLIHSIAYETTPLTENNKTETGKDRLSYH